MSHWFGYDWNSRKTATQRRAEAARTLQDAARRGNPMSPVVLTGRKIAQTFWGKAWCENLERYRDFAYRLERGRSYLRSGSVLDLKIEPGKIAATVAGSSLYEIAIDIDAIRPEAWSALHRECAGSIGSRLDLLAGRLSGPVMARLCADRTGMFPAPSSIRFTCTCPDYATMCKHVAATMYGVGARLDHAPELLFTLRRVSVDELLASALSALPAAPSPGRVLATGGLAALFGIELAEPAPPAPAKPSPRTRKPAPPTAKPAPPTAKPAPPTAKPAPPTAKPAPPTAKPAPRTAKPAPRTAPPTARPAPRAAKPAASATKRAPRATKRAR
jgi:hypothetical protein